MFRYDYAGQTKGPRYELWREEIGRRWVSLDFVPVAGDRIVSELKCTEQAFLGLCTMRGMPLHMDRRNDLLNSSRSSMYLLHASGSRMRASQCGRSIDLHPGQMALVSSEEPARVTQLTEGQRWSIRIPPKILAASCRNIEDMIARPLDGTGELGRLILNQIETAQRFGPKLDAVANYMIAQHLLDLVALCLRADGDLAHLARRRGLARARLDAVRADILRRIGASDVSLAQIAAGHRLSTRYIQHLFEQAGTSFTEFVLDQRLRLAHRMLREPQERWRKISDIAMAAGFSDVSYFNRAFKARYGATPSEVRNEA
jgi:AraC-like DNA-binding protein